jgi:protein gp37
LSDNSKIEWTDATWNPVRGCVKISPGCKHCYAETFAERFRGVRGHPYEQGFDVRLVPEKLTEPFSWRAPKLVFVNSMSDLFQEGVPDEYVELVSRVMATANWHTYQVLTKRSERLRQMLSQRLGVAAELDHIWWGVSVEDRKYGLPRIDDLRAAPARVRFLSIEPLLEDLGKIDLSGISWVIVGGESGPGARPMLKEWVISIRDQCRGQRCLFSSSNGEASGSPATAENWTAEPTMNTLRERSLLSPKNRIACRWPRQLWVASDCFSPRRPQSKRRPVGRLFP